MSGGLNILGKSFEANQCSEGTFSSDGTGSVTLIQANAASEFGVSKLTITGMTVRSDGTTSIIATVKRSDGTTTQITADLLANGSGDIVLCDPNSTKRDAVYLTNDPARQPGNKASVKVPGESENIVYQPVCFVTGTRIRTIRGDVAVEHLRVGDLAITASGEQRRIRWIGHRVIERPAWESAPVRVVAGAFEVDLPKRDLFLSPGHPVLVGADADGEGGHLVPIMCLINGTTIERVPVDEVTYWHVELDAHDVLLAESLPAESYLDWGDRSFFAENSDHALHNPDFVVPGLARRCRPIALDGPIIEAERARLNSVLTMRLVAACNWPNRSNAAIGQ